MGFDLTALLWWFLVVVAVAFLGVLGNKQRAAESQRLKAFASQQGWSYRDVARELVTAWTGPPFVGRGNAVKVFSGLIEGLPFTAFEYVWVQQSGDSSTTYRYPVVAIPLPAALPLLWVLPQDWHNELTNPLGSGDITFESAAFNELFMVSADNDRYAYAVIHPRMMEYLMACPFPGWAVRIEGNSLIFWGRGPQQPGGVAATASWLAGFAKRIPGHVYDQFATNAPRGYAGSVSGLRPEATGRDVLRTVIVCVWGVMWLGISIPMTWLAYQLGVPNSEGSTRFIFMVMPPLFVIIGLAVVGATVVRLIRGGVAIALNRRDRNRNGQGL